MSAHLIYDLVPLGSVVAFSDDTLRPPDRHRKKLAAWKHRNGFGRLIAKHPEANLGSMLLPATFTLHIGDYGSGGVTVMRVHRTIEVTSDLNYCVIERPKIGSVLVLTRPGEDAELVHLAASRADAEAWLQRHGYPHAVLEEVTADTVASDIVEGRAVA